MNIPHFLRKESNRLKNHNTVEFKKRAAQDLRKDGQDII